jgi:vitamin B12 transporter
MFLARYFVLLVLLTSLLFQAQGGEIPEITIYPSLLEEPAFQKGRDIDLSSSFLQQGSLVEVVKQVPGITVSSLGQYGPQSYIKIRGSNTEDTQVRIWGIEINNPSEGGRFDFSNIFPEDVNTIKLRNSSSLKAIGGMIDIEPRKGYGESKMVVSTEGGSYQTYRGHTELSGSTPHQHYFISANALKTGTGKLKNKLHQNTISDWQLKENFSSRFGHKVNEHWDIDVYLCRNQSENDINRYNDQGLPIFSSDRGTNQQSLILVKNRLETLKGQWEHQIVTSGLFYRNEALIRSQGYTDKSQTMNVLYTSNFKITKHQQLIGSLGKVQDNVSLSTSGRHSVNSSNGELTYRTDIIPNLIFDLKGRLEHYNHFKTHATYYTGAKYYFRPALAAFISYGTSFRAPTAFDIGASGPYAVANPNLKPVTSQNFELGGEVSPTRGVTFNLTYFHLDIKNILVTTRTPQGKYQRVNQEGRVTQGLEAYVCLHLRPAFYMYTGYTLTFAKDKQAKRRPIRLPQHMFNIGVQSTDFTPLVLFAETSFQSISDDRAFSNVREPSKLVKLPSFLEIRVGGAYKFNDFVQIKGKIENLFNRSYDTIYGLPGRGIRALIGLQITL